MGCSCSCNDKSSDGACSQPAPLTPAEQARRDKLRLAKPRVYEKVQQYADKVKRGESIAIVQFQYDYRCNFRCEHCSVHDLMGKTDKRSFTMDDVRSLSRQADEMGLAHLVITGGEPLSFPDFDQLVEAIDPQKFYLTSDTNGWLLDSKRAKHLKEIGVDKIQLSLDSLSAEEHDKFRKAPGSHARCLKAIDAAQEAGLNIILCTVVSKQRVWSEEFVQYLEFAKKRGIGVYVTFAKPVGSYAGHFDVMVGREERDHIKALEKKYSMFTHLTPSYGMNFGCIAVRRMISITMFGDVQPCPYMHFSLGNVFKEPLKDIVERGMSIKYFGEDADVCWIGEDREFVRKYIEPLYGKKEHPDCRSVFGPEDFLR